MRTRAFACVRTTISPYVCNFNTCRRLYIDYLFIYLNVRLIDSAVHPFDLSLSPRSVFDCQILRVKQCVSTNGPFLVAVLYFIFNISHIYLTRMCLLNVVALNRCWNNAEMVLGLSLWQAFYGLQIWTICVLIFSYHRHWYFLSGKTVAFMLIKVPQRRHVYSYSCVKCFV